MINPQAACMAERSSNRVLISPEVAQFVAAARAVTRNHRRRLNDSKIIEIHTKINSMTKRMKYDLIAAENACIAFSKTLWAYKCWSQQMDVHRCVSMRSNRSMKNLASIAVYFVFLTKLLDSDRRFRFLNIRLIIEGSGGVTKLPQKRFRRLLIAARNHSHA